MKKTDFFKYSAILLIFAGSYYSCKEKVELTIEPEPTGLKGTKWKLEGIVDVKTGNFLEFDLVAKDFDEWYTLTFLSDTTAFGFSRGNHVKILGLNPFKMSCVTELLECTDDGFPCGFFCDTLKSIKSYTFNHNELIFFFNSNNNYFLYKQINQINQ